VDSTATTRCTARRIGDCDKHCDDNDAQPNRFSHGRRGRDVRYARTIANAHHVSQAFMQSPFPSPPLPLPPRYLLVRASSANKENSTTRGWGLGAYVVLCVEPELSPDVYLKTHEQHQKYPFSFFQDK
jgi:hypothetical protein